jgi:hypothetical protein
VRDTKCGGTAAAGTDRGRSHRAHRRRRGERTDSRTTFRNGHRGKTFTTQADDLDLAIPKVRTGSFFPSLLERRRRIDRALFAVIMEAYAMGVSTRSVDDLVDGGLYVLLVGGYLSPHLWPPDSPRTAGYLPGPGPMTGRRGWPV